MYNPLHICLLGYAFFGHVAFISRVLLVTSLLYARFLINLNVDFMQKGGLFRFSFVYRAATPSPSPLSISLSTLLGLLNSASVPPAVLGNAITSRIDAALHNTATSLSKPIASPPWGGAPAERAASRCEKEDVSVGVSYVQPNQLV